MGGVETLIARAIWFMTLLAAIGAPGPAAAQQDIPSDLRRYVLERMLLIKLECRTVVDRIDDVDIGTIPLTTRVEWASGALISRAGRVLTALHSLDNLVKATTEVTASGKRYNVRCDGDKINVKFYLATSNGLTRALTPDASYDLSEIRSQRLTGATSIDVMVLHADTRGAEDLPFFCPPAKRLRRSDYDNLEIHIGGTARLRGGALQLQFRRGRATTELGSGNGSSFLKFKDAPTEPGMSGGPIVDASGRLVGLIHGSEDRFEVRAEDDLMIPLFLLNSYFEQFGDDCHAPGRIVDAGGGSDPTGPTAGNVTVTIPTAKAEGTIHVGKIIRGASFRGAPSAQAISRSTLLGETLRLQLAGGERNQCDDQDERTGSSASMEASVIKGDAPGNLRLTSSARTHGGFFLNAVSGCASRYHLGKQGNDTQAEAFARYDAEFAIAVPQGGQKLRLEWRDLPPFEYRFVTPTADATEWIKREGTGKELLQPTVAGQYRLLVRASFGCTAEGGSGTCDRDFDGRLAVTVAEPGETRAER